MSGIFITGASGFIGQALAAAFRATGVRVVGVDLVGNAEAGIVQGDTSHPGGWQSHVAGCDVLIHTAAVVSNAVDLKEQWRVNVMGTHEVLHAARRAGVSRVVHLSSVRAFSDTSFPDGVTEDYPVRPDGNPYVDTKIASEQVVLQAHAAGDASVVVLRPADVYGPGSQPWVLKPLELMRRGQFLLPALGRGVHSPVHIDDLVRGVVLAATRDEALGHVFTIGGPRAVTTSEYFGRLARTAGLRGPLVAPTPVALALAASGDRINRLMRRRNEVNTATVRYLTRKGSYSIDKARRLLGYEPRVELTEGMAGTAEWLHRQGLVEPGKA